MTNVHLVTLSSSFNRKELIQLGIQTMLQGGVIVLVSLVYVSILFTIAYVADKRADAGRSMINNPYVYALSLAVYCTAWTFYGSVGRAARDRDRFFADLPRPHLDGGRSGGLSCAR